jgi:hypothetical protein
MNKSGRGGSIYIRILIVLLALSIILASSLYLFIKSPSFIQFLEYAIGTRTGSAVSIGAAHLKKGFVVVIKDLVINRAGSDEPFILLPDTEVKTDFTSLIRRRIERLDLRGPKVFLRLKDDIISGEGGTGFSLPFSLEMALIDNGEVVLQDKEGGSFRISDVNLSLEEKGNNQSEVKGSLFIDELDSTVPFEMTLDSALLNIQKGHMEITLSELEELPYKNIAFLNDKEIIGAVNMGIDIYRKEVPGVRLTVRFQKISITGDKNARLLDNASGELEILLTEKKSFEVVGIEGTGTINHFMNGEVSDHKLSFRGAYDLKGHDLKIEDVSISSSLFGSVDINGSVKGLPSEDPEINLTAEGKDVPLNMIKRLFEGPADKWSDTVAIDGHGRTSLSIKGGLKSLSVHGAMNLDGNMAKIQDFRIGAFNAGASYKYDEGVFVVRDILMRSDDGLHIDDKDYNASLNNLELSISELTYKDSAVRTEHLNVRSDKVVISKEEGGFKTEAGMSLSASLTSVTEGEVTGVTGIADLQITGGNVSTPDGSVASEDIDMKFRSDFGFNIPFTGAEFRMNAEAVGFELLIGRFYGSFKDKRLNVSLKGDYSGVEDTLKIYGAELELTDIGTILFSGNITALTGSPHFNADINLTKLDNGKAFDFLLRETFQESLPLLSQLNVGGTSSMNLSVKGTAARFNVNGELSAADVHLHGKNSGFSVEGLNISLPLEISYPEAAYSAVPERFGSLITRGIKWGSVQIEGLKAFPAIQHNALMFKEDIVIPVFGGHIRLKDIRLDNILSQARSLLLSVHIDGIALDEVTNAFDIPEFSGNLSGFIPKAGITGDNLVTEGEITLDLFGGTISAGDLSVNNIFSSVPSLQTSISIEEIDLGELTGTFEFGHISGTLQGYVNNLVISNSQAESFESFIETVHRKDVKQWISVQALEKITVLGGSSTSVLNRGVYRLFKKYRYEKIGFKGSLRNDNFLLLGISSEGNRQYIIKGGAIPPKVDVINYTQNVSFQEMIERLKRINQIK